MSAKKVTFTRDQGGRYVSGDCRWVIVRRSESVEDGWVVVDFGSGVRAYYSTLAQCRAHVYAAVSA